MNTRRDVRLFFTLPATAALCAAALLAGCGGAEDNDLLSFADVKTSKLSAVRFGQKLTITLTGQMLHRDVEVSATNCANLVQSTTAPLLSTPATSFYQCDLTTVGPGNISVLRVSDNVMMASLPFNVGLPQVTMSVSQSGTSKGDMVITLNPEKAPITVKNFLDYVNAGFYDGTFFHRAGSGFAQGGGFLPSVDGAVPVQKPTLYPPIALESDNGLSNVQWTIAMARTDVPASATSQFFLNLVNNSAIWDAPAGAPARTKGYAVFGTITAGTAIAASIGTATCTTITGFGASSCVPSPTLVVTKAVQSQ
ncbi:MAG: ppiB [Rhizobacter sp.]|nr:ppiB [Rhizobacter sp.]